MYGKRSWHAHNTPGLATIAMDVRNGTALDAVLVSLGVNAEHGKRREEADFRKAYDIACRYGLMQPTDSGAVAKLLRCSVQWARNLTAEARERERTERTERIAREEALRLVNAQADVSAMFADRYTRVDHAVEPELWCRLAWKPAPHARMRRRQRLPRNEIMSGRPL